MARLPDPTGSLSPAAQALYDELVGRQGAGLTACIAACSIIPNWPGAASDLGTFLRFGAGARPPWSGVGYPLAGSPGGRSL